MSPSTARILAIVVLIDRKPFGISRAELANIFKISEASLSRLLATARADFGLGIKIHNKQSGYEITDWGAFNAQWIRKHSEHLLEKAIQ